MSAEEVGVATRNDDAPATAQKKIPKHKQLVDNALFGVTKQMAYRPILWCSCCFTFILFVVVISLATGFAAYSRTSEYEWVIASTQESKNNDALKDAVDQVDRVVKTGTRQETYDENMFFIFDLRKNADLYEPVNIQRMCNVESNLALDKKYPDFCQLDDDGKCQLPATSIVVYFYDFTTIDSWNCTLLDQSVVDTKKNAIYDVMDTPQGQEEYGLWLGSNAPQKGYTTRCASLWVFGAPLDGYNSTSEDDVEQVSFAELFYIYSAFCILI